MLFDILVVFIVTLISSLFICTTSVHGLPSSSSTRHLIYQVPSADLSSSLRLVNHRPIANVNDDLRGDLSEMFIDESNEDESSAEYSLQPSSKLFFFQKRSSPTTQFNLNSAAATLADSSHADNAVNFNQLKDPIRLSPSLKKLVETNPIARIWLTMLLQKLMKEQSVPYIFKYGRRRK